MKISVARTVHYTNLGDKDGKYPPEVIAAVCTGINGDGSVALKALYRTGIFDMPSVQQAPDGVVAGTDAARGMWQWPEREFTGAMLMGDPGAAAKPLTPPPPPATDAAVGEPCALHGGAIHPNGPCAASGQT